MVASPLRAGTLTVHFNNGSPTPLDATYGPKGGPGRNLQKNASDPPTTLQVPA
jgi:hypothetical protein